MRKLVLVIFLSVMIPSYSLANGALFKHFDSMGGVHFGSETRPNLCCHCQQVSEARPVTNGYQYRYYAVDGSVYWIKPDQFFYSDDDNMWICEGVPSTGEISYPSCLVGPAG